MMLFDHFAGRFGIETKCVNFGAEVTDGSVDGAFEFWSSCLEFTTEIFTILVRSTLKIDC